ncbi:3-deoxy-D-manno-oct-2-ulosonic acid (Kdo) hydroxylase [Candidatus Aerophobetes bacterium]|uniref:3-deoxy-D-manno-oct-2-ulosonic acid (Kdo) hydroxylase n=1 Tax=Aerophobetes bacterium TaxID=2030807 RepID=A0A2A4X1Z1_UNCAE|nr:MAG: 3-deoxy-D-manno-oct-2-ulosonic acid (Kdo) hydroxylase [Candidatus Aerophobetes bacterium]
MSNVVEVQEKQGEMPLLQSLEGGKVLLFPKLDFDLIEEEKELVTPKILAGNRKNISFNPRTKELKGAACSAIRESLLKVMLARYSQFAFKLVSEVFGSQSPYVKYEKVSFRPAEIATRESDSTKKDDKKLHVDAFPSNPTQGSRILRVFTNINPSNKPRIWKIGEPFSKVALRFMPTISAPLPLASFLLHQMHITKSRRTPYDHYMLRLHDRMKESSEYQESVEAELFAFQPGATWIVFTDQVSHAVLSGQHVLEQTFSVSNEGLAYKATSPCSILEGLVGKKLI